MSILEVPGASLYYETVGQGPTLLMIPGGNGEAGVYGPAAQHLAARFCVITYDRRGFSRSRLDGPPSDGDRLQTDADDARRLIEHVAEQPATVFGSSSGAIVALEVLISHPSAVHLVVDHEAPAVNLLPDGARWNAFFDGVYDTYRNLGVQPAMRGFIAGISGGVEARAMEHAVDRPLDGDALRNVEYWFECELRQYTRVDLDLAALAAHTDRLILAVGRESDGLLPRLPNEALAEKLDLDLVELPGAHLGYVFHPADFARQLIEAIERKGR